MNIEASIMTFLWSSELFQHRHPFLEIMDLKNATFYCSGIKHFNTRGNKYKSACHGTIGMTGDMEKEFTRNVSHRNFHHRCFVGSLICLCTI